MRYARKTYPAHKCCSCTRETTGKNYCPTCLRALMKMPYTPTPPDITADRGITVHGRRESVNEARG